MQLIDHNLYFRSVDSQESALHAYRAYADQLKAQEKTRDKIARRTLNSVGNWIASGCSAVALQTFANAFGWQPIREGTEIHRLIPASLRDPDLEQTANMLMLLAPHLEDGQAVFYEPTRSQGYTVEIHQSQCYFWPWRPQRGSDHVCLSDMIAFNPEELR